MHSDGAVAKDGRIEVGDQIVQVNNRSFENLTEAQAVRLLREVAAAKKWVILQTFHALPTLFFVFVDFLSYNRLFAIFRFFQVTMKNCDFFLSKAATWDGEIEEMTVIALITP